MKMFRNLSRNLICATALLAGGTALACVDNAYYPVAEGATWTYSGSDGTGFTQSIVAVSADSFTVSMDMDMEGMDGPMEMEFLCDENGILSFANMQSMMPEGVEVEMVSVDGITYPTDWVVGAEWNSEIVMRMEMTMEGMAATSTMTMATDSVILPSESVTVPAGTFDALRVSGDSTVTTITAMMGMEVPFSISTKSDTWLAEGVGMVRTLSDDGTTLELVSYSLP